MPRIPDEIRNRIVFQMEKGETQRKVGLDLNISQSTVNNIWMRYRRYGTTNNRPRSGRPNKTTEKERRHFCRLSMKTPFSSPKQLMTESVFQNTISLRSARRILVNGGLFGRIAARKPRLNKLQLRKRISFSKAYKQMPMSTWHQVIFSDEMRLELYGSRRAYVRRKVGTRYCNKYVCKTVKYGGKSILVWGAIKADGTRILLRCPPILNSSSYQGVLDEGLRVMYDNESVLMHDGAPCHRSHATEVYLERKKICYISDWPPQSPDLNVIENMWSILKTNVNRRFPRTVDDLWKVAEEEWYRIDDSYIDNLYRSIPRRLDTVIKMKGYHSKY